MQKLVATAVLAVLAFASPSVAQAPGNERCEEAAAPPEPAAHVFVRLVNKGVAVNVLLCAMTADGDLVQGRSIDLAAASDTTHGLAIGAGQHIVATIVRSPSYNDALQDYLNPSSCQAKSAHLRVEILDTGQSSSLSSHGWRCTGEAGTPPSGCNAPLQPILPVDPTSGLVTLRINNRGLASHYRLCLFDETGHKRDDLVVPVGPDDSYERTLNVPHGNYSALVSSTSGVIAVSASNWANLTWCKDYSATMVFNFTRGPTSGGVERGAVLCEPLNPAGPSGAGPKNETGPRRDGNTRAPPVAGPMDIHKIPATPTTEQWITGTTISFGGLAFLFALARPRYLLLALFSRLARPRILEHPMRQRIHDLVRQDPGIHIQRVAEVLELGNGQAHYHVGVLLRNRALLQVRSGGRRCLFVPEDPQARRMQAAALLRKPRESSVYNVLQTRPGTSLGEVAKQVGIGVPSASKAVARLEAAGLVRRERAGPLTRLFATSALLAAA